MQYRKSQRRLPKASLQPHPKLLLEKNEVAVVPINAAKGSKTRAPLVVDSLHAESEATAVMTRDVTDATESGEVDETATADATIGIDRILQRIVPTAAHTAQASRGARADIAGVIARVANLAGVRCREKARTEGQGVHVFAVWCVGARCGCALERGTELGSIADELAVRAALSRQVDSEHRRPGEKM